MRPKRLEFAASGAGAAGRKGPANAARTFDTLLEPAILIDPAFRVGRAFFESPPMGKFKPHKGLLKRIRITKSGKIKGRVANGSHLRSGKTATRLRDMRKGRYFASKGVLRRVEHLLGRRVAPARRTETESTSKE